MPEIQIKRFSALPKLAARIAVYIDGTLHQFSEPFLMNLLPAEDWDLAKSDSAMRRLACILAFEKHEKN